MTTRELRDLADALEACDTARDTRRDSVRAEVPLELHAKSIAALRHIAREQGLHDEHNTWPTPAPKRSAAR